MIRIDLAYDYDDVKDNNSHPNVQQDHHPYFTAYFRRAVQVYNLELHARLQLDLVEEIWNRHRARQRSQS